MPDDLVVHVSKRADGTMFDRSLSNRHGANVVQNRVEFCKKVGIAYENCVYQIIAYAASNPYNTIREVDQPNTDGVEADVLFTKAKNIGLFLPIADCVGTVLYDVSQNRLAVAHLGRHASVAKTIKKTIELFIQKGSKPSDLYVYMAPSVKQQDYVMEYFDHAHDSDWQQFVRQEDDGIHLDLQGFNRNLALQMGVSAQNIHVSPINTARSVEYFSHSQGDTKGRFALLAMMK